MAASKKLTGRPVVNARKRKLGVKGNDVETVSELRLPPEWKQALSVGSVGDESVGDESVGDESVGDESVGDESVGDESVGDEDDGGVWALAEMAGCSAIDPRFVRTAARNADRLVTRCQESLSAACGPDGRQAATRLFHHKDLTVEKLLQGHFDQTSGRCALHEVIIVADDTSAYNYSGHTSLQGLGPINHNHLNRGFWGHAALAMTTQGLPLGLLGLNLWARDVTEMGKSKDRRKRPLEEKESYKWLQALQAIEKNVGEHPCVYIVTDRESDIFGYVAAPRRASTHLLFRAAWDRNAEAVEDTLVEASVTEASVTEEAVTEEAATEASSRGALDTERLGEVSGRQECSKQEGRKGYLSEMIEGAPEVARAKVRVGRRPGQKDREAEISIRAVEVYLLPPRHSSPGESNIKQKVTLLRAVELCLVEPGLVEPGLVEPGLVEPGLVEPGLVEPGLVGRQKRGTGPASSRAQKGTKATPAENTAENAAENTVEPVDWILISTESLDEDPRNKDPQKRAAKARDLIYYYSLRWGIERLHYTLKSGCGVEKLQIGSVPALMNALAFYHIVAWRLLSLMHLSRCAPETPAEAELTADELAVLRAIERKPVKTMAEAVRAIARLGGYEVYRSAPPPGVKRLWLGLRALQQMVAGWRLARSLPSSQL